MQNLLTPNQNQKQLKRVFDVISDGQWKSLEQIATITGDSTKSISSRLRDLRLPQFGNHQIESRKINPQTQTWEYRLLTAQPAQQPIIPTLRIRDRSLQIKVIRFLNVNTMSVEFVPADKCEIITYGHKNQYSRIVAKDNTGQVMSHLLTTQKEIDV